MTFIPDRDASGKPIYASDKLTGDFNTLITHNFCDNQTWVVSPSDSTWKLEPSAGTVMRLDKAEVQFVHDLWLRNPINYISIFIDYYAWVGGGSTALAKRITLDTTESIFELGNEHYHAPSLPGMTAGLSTVVFNYVSKLSFYGDDTPGSLNRIELSVENHNQPTGTYATVSFIVQEEAL